MFLYCCAFMSTFLVMFCFCIVCSSCANMPFANKIIYMHWEYEKDKNGSNAYRVLLRRDIFVLFYLGRVKRIWYLSPMRAAKVQASLRIRAVSPEPPLLAHTSSESRGTFRQKARSLAPLNGWACAVKICHDGMLEDTNSLDGAHFISINSLIRKLLWDAKISVTCIKHYFFFQSFPFIQKTVMNLEYFSYLFVYIRNLLYFSTMIP